ncbi:MAG: right-handed parallel beta-helix repeat-containing protein, partial [Pirellulales bacterium]|nr:right-handed parallel beta-helix repeat-containing protein [Pirellulales bacterium]
HVAATGTYTSASSVSATDSGLGLSVGDVASSTYFGVAPNVALEASSTGYGFDDQGRTLVASGDLIETSYLVSNTGNDPLSGVQVLSNSVVAAAVLNGSTNVGDVNQDGFLDTDEVWEFTASHVAATGAYTSVSSVAATDSGLGLSVADGVSATYFGVAPNVALEAYLLDEDGNPLEDPVVTVGEEVHFLYRVINTGNIHLNALELAGASSVLDGSCNVGDLDCDGLLDTDEVWKYESLGTASPGEQSNTVVVTASAETSSQIVQSTVEGTYIGEYRDLVVTHTGDFGVGSLRYVIEDALSRPNGGNITFAIPETDPSFVDAASSFVIQPLSPLPTLDGPVGIWIDGLQGGQDFDAGVSAPQIVIDGSLAGEANGLELFSDNNGIVGIGIQNFQGAGIHINGSGNIVARNYIGVDAQGDDAGNRDDGIWIEAGSNNMVGGFEEDPQNVIAYNGGNGVSVTAGTGNTIAANEFFHNFAMSIDLGNDGLTSNDVVAGLVDADVGANDRLNTPVITRIEVIGNLVEVDYSVPTNADALQEPLRIEFFLADESRREGEVFLGTDEYTHEDFLQGGKTLQVELEDLPSQVIPVVATATSFEGNTSEFSAPRGVSFVGRTVESRVLEIADDVTGGIQNALEQWLAADPSDVPISDIAPPTEEILFDDPTIDEIFIGRGVVAGDDSDHAIDLGNADDPLVTVGFGQSVDNVTMAVNNYCTEQVVAMCDTLELVVGQMVACIWFDPINFSVSIGGNEVSYDYDTNPSAIVGSIPGASLVVTPAGQSTPGGVQTIMFVGDASNINIQMSTTNSGALMRGGVNVYTVGSGSGGPTIQPMIRSAFQGYLPSDTIAMSFDPSQPSFASSGMSGAMAQAVMDS